MWNDKETDIDLLGYDKIADTILEIVKDQHLRPLTIGVYGDWGVGKSSILSLLQKKVKELPKEESKKTHTIVFNGWLFQGYEDTKSALMETIVTDLARLQPKSEKVKKLAKSLLRRINWLKVAKVSASAIWTGVTGIPNPGMLSGVIGVAENAKKLFTKKEEKEGLNVTVEQKDDESFLNESEENTVPSQIHAFRQEFKELIESSKIEQLIILVDDLDRCLPKSVIDILEAIRLFLFVEGTVFVISADEKMIEYAVRDHFPNLPSDYSEYTKNYLEKLIQIPIRIPTLNKLQTGNYIKFLMLQNHLGNNLSEVERVYKHYETKKSLPYENVELTYTIIKEAFGGDPESLRQMLLVADQLYPVLSTGLKGNPRNIKRFLNTLFLRIKIGKIYGLEQVVKLDVLAKLMLLERFHSDVYGDLVNEVLGSSNGKSKMIEEYEKKAEGDSSEAKPEFLKWSKLLPALKDEDLRPYVFISKEKAISFDQEQALTPILLSLFAQLESGALMNLNEAERGLASISPQDANVLFEKLLVPCKSLQDLVRQPNQMKGLYRVIKVFPQLEIKLMDFISTKPATSIGVWAISESTGLTTQEARTKFNALLDTWQQNGNRALKALAKQTTKL